MKYDVFLSYNGLDEAVVGELSQLIERRGFAPYFDPKTGHSNASDLDSGIKNSIEQSSHFILIHGKNCLSNYQIREARHADRLAAGGLKFINVMLGKCKFTDEKGYCQNNPFSSYGWIKGSPYLLSEGVVGWLDEFQESHEWKLLSLDGKYETHLSQIIIPDSTVTHHLKWPHYGRLLGIIKEQISRRSLSFLQAIFGINDCGLATAAHLRGVFSVPALGHLQVVQHAPSREVLLDKSCFPKLSTKRADVLLVDSELKSGSALRAVLPVLRQQYEGIDLRCYYAVLYAQMSATHWPNSKQPAGMALACKELLAADGLEELGLADIFIGGLFGNGKIEPPMSIR